MWILDTDSLTLFLQGHPTVTDNLAAKAPKPYGQATNDDYILLGYFYSLEKKYDQPEANYLKALELATDDARKYIIRKELEKLRAATSEVKPVDK